MQALLADHLLLLCIVLTVMPIGIAAVRLLTPLRGMDLIGYGAAAGVAVQAFVGLCIALFPAARLLLVALDLAGAIAAFVYFWRARVLTELVAAVPRSLKLCTLLWLGFSAFCVSITHLEIRLPQELPDGPFIFKSDTVNVRLQHLTNLPADNFIPFVVTEYLLRGVSFQTERPPLPGNEISNRTILMSLTAIPYRAAISPPPRLKGKLGTFEYVGRTWPAVERLYTDAAYRQVLVAGIFLNGLLLLGLLVVFQERAADRVLLPCAAMLAFTNPYLLTQTVFIWPKELAGFFLLLAWRSLRLGHHPAVVAGCAALAYHSHPYAGVFVLGLGIWYARAAVVDRSSLRAVILFGVTFAVAVAPWFLWTRVLLDLPSNLLWQNVAGEGTVNALAAPVDFVWVRFRNLFVLGTPMMFGVYPFDAKETVHWAQTGFPGTVGVFLIVPAVIGALESARRRKYHWIAIAFPALFIVLLFSYMALPILHGYQAIVGALLFYGVVTLRRWLTPKWFWAVMLLQLMCNLALIAMRGFTAGVHVG